MARVIVVGSGASGVHFAQEALAQGHHVEMVDVGHAPPPPTLPSDETLEQLKTHGARSLRYFLGDRFQSVLLPHDRREYYGLPPSKDYVFLTPEHWHPQSDGFVPLYSFAEGGLAQAWTAGCYPFDPRELATFPWPAHELAPYYDAVASHIGVTGEADDTSRYFPVHAHLDRPLPLDAHGDYLVRRYAARRSAFHREGIYLGRSRVAVRVEDQDERRGCWHCGRCLWGCPSGSLYTPRLTLQAIRQHPSFVYHGGWLVEAGRLDAHDRLESLTATRTDDGTRREFSGDYYVLAAGTLSSAHIFLRTLQQNRHERLMLRGLMDNRQVLVPFVTLGMLGQPVHTAHYQYHQLMMALETSSIDDLVHCQITTLKGAAVHPLIQSIPLGLRSALEAFPWIRSGLGLANVNLADWRRDENYVTLGESPRGDKAPLLIHYRPPHDEPQRLRAIVARVRRALRKLGAIAPSPMVRIRPMGASVHYAGVLPMSETPQSLTTSPWGRSHDIGNLFLADGSTFNRLPAKNLTFTLMANARRIAARGLSPISTPTTTPIY